MLFPGFGEFDIFLQRPLGRTADALRAGLGGPLPERPGDPDTVVRQLAAAAAPGLVGVPGGRYFGFVTGGAVPASLAADWLTAASITRMTAGAIVQIISILELPCVNFARPPSTAR